MTELWADTWSIKKSNPKGEQRPLEAALKQVPQKKAKNI